MDLTGLLHGDIRGVIESFGPLVGYLVVFGMVFLESGLLIGFFFPGDSLLFTAGLLASQGFFDVKILLLGCFLAAVIGDTIGYFIGYKLGRKLFQKEDSFLFRKAHLVRAEDFYKKHGGKTIILARFMPVIRAFAPVVAGVGSMTYPTFLFYNLFGGFIWAVGLILLGNYLGSTVPNIDKYLLPIIGAIVLASIAPAIYHTLKDENARKSIFNLFRLKR